MHCHWTRYLHRGLYWLLVCYGAARLLAPVAAFAQVGADISVRTVGSAQLEVEPRQIVVASFRIENHLNRPVTLLESLELPAGWQEFMIPPPFTLAANASEVRLVSFRVPISALAQRYTFTYSVSDIDNPGSRGEDTLQVLVLPMVKLELNADEVPKTVIAGQDYQVRYTAINFSNVPMRVEVKTQNRANGFPFIVTPAEFTAEPGARRQITVEVRTDGEMRRQVEDIVRVGLRGKPLVEDAEYPTDTISADKIVRVRIFPRVTGVEDNYQRLPVDFSVISTSARDGETDTQVELRGGGILDQHGNTYLDFLLRSAGSGQASIFGLREEYRLWLRHNRSEWRLGDFSYRLTPLTELNRYGRGVSGTTEFDKLSLGLYHVQNIETGDSNESAGFMAYQFSDSVATSINYLQKNTPAEDGIRGDDMGSVVLNVEPSRAVKMALEYSAAQTDDDTAGKARDDAYRAELYGGIGGDRLNYSLQHIHAGPNYGGYYQDQEITRAALGLRLSGRLRFHSFYSELESNLRLNPDKGNAASERRGSYGFQYQLPFSTNLSLDYQEAERIDSLSLVERRDRNYQLTFSGAWNQFSFVAALSQGRLQDSTLSDVRDTRRDFVSAQFRPSGNQSYRLYYERGENNFFDESESRNSAGASVFYQWRDSLRLGADYRRNDASPDQLSADIEYRRRNNHRISLRARYLFADEAQQRLEDSVISFNYSVPIDIPIRRRTEIGALRGRVFDSDDPDRGGIADVIVRVNGAVAVTDGKGNFFFPSLSPTHYQLVIEDNKGADGRITALPTPMPLVITGGETVDLDIAMTRAASVGGRIRVYRAADSRSVFTDDREIPEEQLEDAYGLANVTVQLIKGEERITRSTDADGGFRFPDLRPGLWRLRLFQSDLPSFHRVRGATVSPPYVDVPIEVRAGDRLEQTIQVLPVTRTIEIIDNGIVSS